MRGTCCSFRGSSVLWYLLALGRSDLVLDLYAEKTSEEAIATAERLRDAVRAVREVMNEALHDASEPSDRTLEKQVMVVPDIGWQLPFGQAFEAIEAAARWHEKIGQLSFGVKARY